MVTVEPPPAPVATLFGVFLTAVHAVLTTCPSLSGGDEKRAVETRRALTSAVTLCPRWTALVRIQPSTVAATTICVAMAMEWHVSNSIATLRVCVRP